MITATGEGNTAAVAIDADLVDEYVRKAVERRTDDGGPPVS